VECALSGGHLAGLELTRTAGLSEDESHGQTPPTIQRVRETQPSIYLQVVSKLVPRDIELHMQDQIVFSEEELTMIIEACQKVEEQRRQADEEQKNFCSISHQSAKVEDDALTRLPQLG
jgi:formate dehydrogenase maturation protein FdhE